jgi:hypothetical protein
MVSAWGLDDFGAGRNRMEATRSVKLEKLKASVGRAEYRVDVDAVAEAIVARLLAGREGLHARYPDGPCPGSGDVLEAG